MPDKPTWCGHLDEIARRLLALPDPWIDRAMLEELLGIGRRRAQQILAPCVSRQIGANGLADRTVLLNRLRCLAANKKTETVSYERQRRQQLAAQLDQWRRSWLEQSSVLVESPLSIVDSRLDGLPDGVSVDRGEIRVRFETATQALEKLLALAMAIGNDRDRFERIAAGKE